MDHDSFDMSLYLLNISQVNLFDVYCTTMSWTVREARNNGISNKRVARVHLCRNVRRRFSCKIDSQGAPLTGPTVSFFTIIIVKVCRSKQVQLYMYLLIYLNDISVGRHIDVPY